ncbi:NTP transferase domain-containing protein [Kineococcus aurantiacus]|uniref:CTP:molybdopterin cytidylyltransferase MocA n=1 Tax=Kineococcus aurantiacus TaxID=37633 RepID=A0A7Y9DKR2_9ACTN|nr:CTP:molybdopterin cytidylyltransferase MocA [Kineococcus aurantiacus]
MDDVAIVVVAGGGGERFRAAGGGDKLDAPLGSTTVRGALLAGLRGWRVVVVGPGGVREDPPGGGPLAGFAAGLAAVEEDLVVLLGGDQPFAADAVPRLLGALRADPALDAVVGVDPGGRRQPLLSAHRRRSALRVLDGLPAVAGQPLRELFRGRVGPVPVTAREALDVDVPADLLRARALAGGAAVGEAGPGGGS